MNISYRSLISAVGATALLGLSGCSTAPPLPSGPAAYAIMHVANDPIAVGEYRIGRLDVLRITVPYEPDLSSQEIHVDANGDISFPLIGETRALGKTASELGDDISRQLQKYLRDPRVNVTVLTSARQKVTIEGDVNVPGAYDINGSSSLLEALARAQSPNRIASLSDVAVFRMIDGRRVGAVFDVKRIRAGQDPDPLILGGDIVVVGLSYVKSTYRDMLSAASVVSAIRGH